MSGFDLRQAQGKPARERGVMENPDWDPKLVIDIERRPAPGMRI
jgi:hypothetical protein